MSGRAGDRARLAWAWQTAAERYEAALSMADGSALTDRNRLKSRRIIRSAPIAMRMTAVSMNTLIAWIAVEDFKDSAWQQRTRRYPRHQGSRSA